MKKNYIVLLLIFLFSGVMVAQDQQKNFINYQGVARSADNALMVSEQMTITIALKFGASNAAVVYEESHAIATDANGVFSLLIGNGISLIGDFNSLPWGSAATFVTVSMNGNEIGTTEMMAVPYAISSGDAKQSAADVPYDNSSSGLVASSTQAAIDELATGGSIDADADPTNEIQSISFDAASNTISLTDGGEITIPSGGTDADADPENELQTLAFDAGTNELSLSDGNSIVIPTGGVDGDGDSTNEIQTISFDAVSNKISLTDGGEITIPSGGIDADSDPENEIDVTRRHGLLVGDDGIVDGLVGTADGQVAKWDAALGNWVAGTDETSLGGGSSTGLEALDEGNGIGWRLIGRDPAFYGTIGLNATDLSLSETNSSTRGAIGISATAMGEETTASGPRSTALGYGAQATGPVSTSIGEETVASGEFAVAMGDRTLASEQSSTAFGAGTKATNTHATAMGESTTASGKSATSTGISTKAESLGSLAVGRNNIGGGDPFVWQPNDPLFEVGNGSETIPSNALTVLKNGMIGVGTAAPAAMLQVEGNIRSSDLSGTGQRNVMADANGNLVIGAGGTGSTSTGLETLEEGLGYGWRLIGRDVSNFGSIGFNAIDMSSSNSSSAERGARGNYSIAMGENTEASGQWSTAMGKGTKALGDYSIAMGDGSIAKENKSTAMGFASEANGFTSTAMGFNTKADGYYATAIGLRTISGTYASTAIGHYNVGATGDILAWDPNDPLFEIGNGEFGARRNALMVLKNGNMGVGNITPTTTLDVDGSTRIRDLSGAGQRNVMADADGNLVIGSSVGGSSVWTENEGNIHYEGGNVGIGTASPARPLHVVGGEDNSIRFESATERNWVSYFNSSGYIGYSGIFTGSNDMDFGTAFLNGTGKVHLTTNALPKLTVVPNGNVGIGTTNPSTKLEVLGDIKTSSEVHGANTGTANMIPYAYGVVASAGTKSSGSDNFTVSRTGEGTYVIVFAGARIDARYAVVLTRGNLFPGFINYSYTLSESLFIATKDIDGLQNDNGFSFVIFKP